MLNINENFRPLSIDTIVLNEPLPFDLYVNHSNHLVKFIKAEEILCCEKKEQLINNKMNHFYIQSLNSTKFETYLTNNIREILNSSTLNKTQKSEIIYTSAIHIMQDMFESTISESKIMVAKNVMSETVKQIISNDVTAASILKLSSHDYKTYSHCVNVALYSIGIAYEYGLNTKLITEIASGAILHDVGKSEIEECIINKKGKLSLEEFESMKGHPKYSYEILLKNGERNPVILDIVLSHHEKLDGSGYGRALKKHEISLASQIVTIADIFDALSSNRSYKDASSFFGALKIMKKEMKEQLNIELVDALIKMMGKA